MFKKMAANKQKIGIVLLLAAVCGLIYWAYVSRPHPAEDTGSSDRSVTYSNNTLKEEVNGKLVWECYAETMTIDQDTQTVTMENIKGTFYRDDGTSITLTAPKGTYDQAQKHLEMQENIHAESTDGMAFDTGKVTWDGQQGVLTCENSVKIKKPGMQAEADKAESKDAFKNFKLIGNAKLIKGDIQNE